MSLLKKYLERMEETLSKLDLIIWTFSFLFYFVCVNIVSIVLSHIMYISMKSKNKNYFIPIIMYGKLIA